MEDDGTPEAFMDITVRLLLSLHRLSESLKRSTIAAESLADSLDNDGARGV